MTNPTLPAFESIFTNISASVAVLSVLFAVVASIRSGSIKYIRFGSIEIEGSITPREVEALDGSHKNQPFEATALSNYYNHALSRANISFWFSLIFASIGFGVIIFAFATHNAADLAGTIVKATSGAVIDAVSSLFFIQSNAAQKSMSEFFEKLRQDRLNVDARNLINEIENAERRDQLKSQLVLKYSGIDKLLTDSSQ